MITTETKPRPPLNRLQYMDILTRLNDPDMKLSKSERRVAEVVLSDPEAVIRAPIALVARLAGVSEPTVNRFSHRLGCSGYPDFKMKLAQELAKGRVQMTRNVSADDSTTVLLDTIFDATQASLSETRNRTDCVALERAILVLAQARTILFLGLGASGIVALDAQHKFIRINTPVLAHQDILNQRMVCAGMGQQDVGVFISFTGRTIAVIDNAVIARQNGATVIGITRSGAPLAAHCDIVLPVETPEDTDLYTPMSSRIAQLTLIDVLATGVALKRGPQFSRHLEHLKESLRDTRVSRAS